MSAEIEEIVSNREVLDLLLRNKSKTNPTNLATILYETTSYLEASPAASCSLSNIAEFLDELNEREYNLSKLEKIQLVNLKPQSELELHLIVENVEEERPDLLQLIEKTLNKTADNPVKKFKQ